MHISNDFKAFDQKTLILVTSRQDAIGYLANQRNLEKVIEIHTDKVRYTDNEGRFERSGDGRTYGSGATEKEIDDITYEEFQRDLADKLDALDKDFDQIILFAPEEYKNKTKDALPKNLRDKIAAVHGAHIIHEHPTDILKRLQ